MARTGKQHVFSTTTTEEGLRQLNELKAKLGLGHDDVVINAVCAHYYGLDRLAVALPKVYAAHKKTEEKKKGGTKNYGKSKVATEQATDEAEGN